MANSKGLSKKAVTGEVMMATKVAGGFAAGNVTINALEKVLKVDASSSLPKRIIAPIAVATASAVVAIKAKSASVKQVAVGAGAAAAIRTARAVAPKATLLQGLAGQPEEQLGLTPIAAISQNEDWVHRDASGNLAFPDLGEVQPPQNNNGYFVDAPAYLGDATRDDSGILGIEDAQIL